MEAQKALNDQRKAVEQEKRRLLKQKLEAVNTNVEDLDKSLD